MPLLRNPFLRLLLPLALGIALGDAFPYPVPLWGYALLLALFLFLTIRFGHRNGGFGVAVYLIFFGMGYGVMSHEKEKTAFPFSDKAAVYRVRLQDAPEEKPNSLRLQALLLEEVRHDTLVSYPENPLFLIYMSKSAAADSLRRGDELLIHARLAPFTPNGNPDEFDYAEYMERKGYSGRAYVADGHWKLTGHDPRRSLRQVAQDYRRAVTELYRRLSIRGDELAVLSAITVGEKSGLSNRLKETYATTGASHVLALSGMHVGLIYGVLLLLVSPLWKRWRRVKPLLIFLIILLMGCFAFLTGLSPSVVRAVAMFSLFALAELLTENPLKLNIISATAFFMLLCRPMWLFDVSFQLSFMAIIAFAFVQPKLFALWSVKHRALRYVWKLVSASIAVQICSAPLLMFYFSRFTFHFLLSNVWVIPWMSLVLYSGIVLLILTPVPLLQLPTAWLVKLLIGVQNGLLRGIERLPGFSLEGIWLDAWGVLLMFLFLVTAYFALSHRTPRNLRLSLCALLAFAGWHSYTMIAYAPRQGIAFYNVKNGPAVHCLTNGSRSWMVCADSAQTWPYLQRSLASHWNRLRIDAPQRVADDEPATPGLWMREGIVCYANRRICLVSDDRWLGKRSAHPLAMDCVYISRGYRGGIGELTPLFRIGTLVVDASLPYYRQERIAAECARLGIACHLLARQGAFRTDPRR